MHCKMTANSVVIKPLKNRYWAKTVESQFKFSHGCDLSFTFPDPIKPRLIDTGATDIAPISSNPMINITVNHPAEIVSVDSVVKCLRQQKATTGEIRSILVHIFGLKKAAANDKAR